MRGCPPLSPRRAPPRDGPQAAYNTPNKPLARIGRYRPHTLGYIVGVGQERGMIQARFRKGLCREKVGVDVLRVDAHLSGHGQRHPAVVLGLPWSSSKTNKWPYDLEIAKAK